MWVDFDVAVTFPNKESMDSMAVEYTKHEAALTASFGELLVCCTSPMHSKA